jgi:cysteine-rich repeat protein
MRKRKIAKACGPTLGSVRADLDTHCTGVDLQTTFPGPSPRAMRRRSLPQCLDEASRCRVCRAAKNGDALNVVRRRRRQAGQRQLRAICGDGFIEGTEECDDGNVTSEDGCSSACAAESCGDGVSRRDSVRDATTAIT